jgi:hypothetical protein
MKTLTRVTVQRTQTLVYELDGTVPKEEAIQIVRARIDADYQLDLKSDITAVVTTHVETVKE